MNAITMLLGLAPIPARPACAPVRKHSSNDLPTHRLPELPPCTSPDERTQEAHKQRADILRLLAAAEQPMRTIEIAAALGLRPLIVTDRLYALKKLGKVHFERHLRCGRWELVTEDEE